MLVNFGVLLSDLDGKPLEDERNKAPFTLRHVAMNALVGNYRGEDSLSGEDKLKRWELALRLRSSQDPMEVTVEEVALMKLLISKMFGTLVVGQAYNLLESAISSKS